MRKIKFPIKNSTKAYFYLPSDILKWSSLCCLQLPLGPQKKAADLWAKERRYSTSIGNPGCATPVTGKHGPLGASPMILPHLKKKFQSGTKFEHSDDRIQNFLTHLWMFGAIKLQPDSRGYKAFTNGIPLAEITSETDYFTSLFFVIKFMVVVAIGSRNKYFTVEKSPTRDC